MFCKTAVHSGSRRERSEFEWACAIASARASATSVPHLRALAVAVERALAAKGEHARVSGDAESAWIVLDYTDVMVHLFLPDARRYYDIESLWKAR